jgi:hypothetical protein
LSFLVSPYADMSVLLDFLSFDTTLSLESSLKTDLSFPETESVELSLASSGSLDLFLSSTGTDDSDFSLAISYPFSFPSVDSSVEIF